MLVLAMKYRQAVDIITADKALKLWKYEMDDEDWEIVKDLIRVLKVCSMFIVMATTKPRHLDLQRCDYLLFAGQCCDNCTCYSDYGPDQ